MLNEDYENQKLENQAMTVAKEKAKQETKKQIKKLIMKKLAAIISAKAMLIILLVFLGFVIFFSIFGWVVNIAIDEQNNESYESEEAKIDITSEDLQAGSVDAIKNFIKAYDSTKAEKMLDKADKIYEWQTQYGYSGYFLVVVIYEENMYEYAVGSEEFTDYLNKINEHAEKWNNKGYKTILEIAEEYVGDDTSSEWANNIARKMPKDVKIYEVTESQETDGYYSDGSGEDETTNGYYSE